VVRWRTRTGRDYGGGNREGVVRNDGKDFCGMRVMFFTWITLIAAGLVFYTVIGLTHN
jgi:hypothetical protein